MTDHSGSAPRMAPQRRDPQGALEELVGSQSVETLRDVAASPRLTEDIALSLLTRRDLPHQAIEDLARNGAVMKHRKVIIAVAGHPRAPRHVSLPIVRHLYTFELMQLALAPSLPADLKMAIEETLIARLETISEGERMTLARRGSTRIAATLLCDPQPRIIHAALANPHLTEVCVVKGLLKDDAPAALVKAVCDHAKWSLRRDVQVALLRSEETPLARVLAIAHALPVQVLRDVLSHSRLDARVKTYLLHDIEERTKK